MSRLLAVVAAAGTSVAAAGAASAVPPFAASVSPVRWSDVRHSYRVGCPVGPAELRLVRVSYRGFDGRARTGSLVVHRRVTRDVVAVFRRLYEARFPIRRMVPVARYRGSDDASMAADNTSAFNCRRSTGGTSWSEHSYGRALDINPVQNPYVKGTVVLPAAGRAYVDRWPLRKGMVTWTVRDAFADAGWSWGGAWRTLKDYQHFSRTGS